MPEQIPTPQPVEAPRTVAEIEKEELERYDAWMADHPMVEAVQESAEVCAERAAQGEALMNSFEQTYDLEALRAITQFSSREEREASPRQSALEALSRIFKLLKPLHYQKAFADETRAALTPRYEMLSQAVGNITGDPSGKIFDIVVHDRPTPFPN